MSNDPSLDYDDNSPIDEDDQDDSVLSGENNRDNDKLSHILSEATLRQLLTKRKKCIHFFCNQILLVSFLPTLFYNLFWIVTITKSIHELNNESCGNFPKFLHEIVIFCFTVLITGFIILFFPVLFCGLDRKISDLNFSCVGVKTLTSLIFSFILTKYMEKNLINSNNQISFGLCNKLNYWATLFYKFEIFYINGTVTVVLMGVAVLILVISRECWKTRKYTV